MAGRGSFDEFYAGAAGRLVGQLFPVTGDLHEAEEVVQEAFTRAAARWSRLRDYDVPEAWVRRVAMNLAADRARHLRRQARAMLKLRPPPEVLPASVEALALAEALRTLPIRQRQVLVLHYLVDLPVEEVAHTLGMPDGTVKSLLSRRTPGPQAARRRANLRRLRLFGGTAILVVLAVVAGMVGTDRLSDPPTPLTPTPTAGPTSTTIATNATVPLPRWIPSVTPLTVKAQPGPYPGPDPDGIVRDVTSLVRGCQGTSRVRLWARAEGKVWLIAAKPPPPGRQHVCWASALIDQGGGGALGTQSSGLKPLRVTFAGGGGNRQLGVVSGMVTKRAVRLRVLFHKGAPLDLVPVDAGDQFPLNFWAGLFLETGPPPAEGQERVLAVDRVLAFDRAGNQVAACRVRLDLGRTC